MGRADKFLVVEVVYALADEQVLHSVTLPRGSTIQNALERSGIIRRFPGVDFNTCKVGVFGSVRPRDTALSAGDRVEIYRPLLVDPKDARHARVRRGKRRDEG